MSPHKNVIGQNVTKWRYQRGWTQEELVTKLQLARCPVTRDILANIETRRCSVTEVLMLALAAALQVSPLELLPSDWPSQVEQIHAQTPLIIRQRRRKKPRHGRRQNPRPPAD